MASIRKRKRKDGSASYRVDVRLKGFPPQRATFSRLTDAKRWAQHTESAIREGRYFKTSESRKHTFSDLVDRYINEVLPGKSADACRVQTAQMLWWKTQLGHFTLADVTPARIVECREKLLREPTKRGEHRAPATVVRYMAALSHAFGIAVNEWEWLESSPMAKVRKPQEPRGRVRFLSDDERGRLLLECKKSSNEYLYIIVLLALSTGMRQGEIMNLTWDQVDLENNRITLLKTKNGEIRVVPLAGKARNDIEEFSKIRNLNSSLLFPGRRNPKSPIDIRNPWNQAVTNAQLEDFRFHDLRHTAASYLAMSGATLAEIAEVLGHKTLQMVNRYAHLSEPHTASVVERMNNNMF